MGGIQYTDDNVGVVRDGKLHLPPLDILGDPFTLDRASIQYIDATHFVMLPPGYRGEIPPYIPSRKKNAKEEQVVPTDNTT